MVKAAAGGGGKGMRMVREAGELAGRCSPRFGGARGFRRRAVYLEKFISGPAMSRSRCWPTGTDHHLGERECSIQRRHQKLIEEAPSVAVSAELRERMGAAAVAAAQAAGYVARAPASSCSSRIGEFYFLEMNTRIQVEHPVTELVYGVDLVQEQLRIAAGSPCGSHAGWQPRGWAMECRITSEDPANGFLPSTGRIALPPRAGGPGVRWDSGVETGDEVTLYYDSLLAKLIVWAPDRAQAIDPDDAGAGRAGGRPGLLPTRRSIAGSWPTRRSGKGDIDIQFLERRADLLAQSVDPGRGPRPRRRRGAGGRPRPPCPASARHRGNRVVERVGQAGAERRSLP